MKNYFSRVFLFCFLFFPMFAQGQKNVSGNEFNPAISLILDGRFTDIDEQELELPGFQLAGEAGLPEPGFSTGHNELVISSNIDDRFYGELSAAIVKEEGETVVELEEAFFQTLALGKGLTVQGGRFFSDIGYLNSIHDHAHDFADRPLVYDALFGGHLADEGLQLTWIAPTDFFLKTGVEFTTGSSFPGGENEGGDAGKSIFLKTGADYGESSSWQAGVSAYQSEFEVREAGGHAHGTEQTVDNELLDGEVDLLGFDFVYKWAPNGNAKQKNLKLQFEYFIRNEEAQAEFVEGNNSAEANYDGEQDGYYTQLVYQFRPAWRIGARYDGLTAENEISGFVNNGIGRNEFLEESSLGTEGDPEQVSLMLDYSNSHFSRIRFQFSRLDNGSGETEDRAIVQYQMSLGSHGAHQF